MELFITGTGTGVGKTFVTALLAHHFHEKGMKTGVQKWVSTGNPGFADDLAFIAKNVPGLEQNKGINSNLQSIYCLEFPASPHLAAEKQKVVISSEKIIHGFKEMKEHFQILMVEGAGGLMVPLTRETLLIDIVEELKLPTLIVAAAGLGTINHTLLSIEALRQRKIPCAGVVLNSQEYPPAVANEMEHPDIVRDNARVIEDISGVPILGVLDRVKTFDKAIDSGNSIFSKLLHSPVL